MLELIFALTLDTVAILQLMEREGLFNYRLVVVKIRNSTFADRIVVPIMQIFISWKL